MGNTGQLTRYTGNFRISMRPSEPVMLLANQMTVIAKPGQVHTGAYWCILKYESDQDWP